MGWGAGPSGGTWSGGWLLGGALLGDGWLLGGVPAGWPGGLEDAGGATPPSWPRDGGVETVDAPELWPAAGVWPFTPGAD